MLVVLINKRKIYWIMVLSEAGQTVRYWEPWPANTPTNGFIIRGSQQQSGAVTGRGLQTFSNLLLAGMLDCSYKIVLYIMRENQITHNTPPQSAKMLWNILERFSTLWSFHLTKKILNYLWQVKKETFHPHFILFCRLHYKVHLCVIMIPHTRWARWSRPSPGTENHPLINNFSRCVLYV